jgi:hypothetical protein
MSYAPLTLPLGTSRLLFSSDDGETWTVGAPAVELEERNPVALGTHFTSRAAVLEHLGAAAPLELRVDRVEYAVAAPCSVSCLDDVRPPQFYSSLRTALARRFPYAQVVVRETTAAMDEWTLHGATLGTCTGTFIPGWPSPGVTVSPLSAPVNKFAVLNVLMAAWR